MGRSAAIGKPEQWLEDVDDVEFDQWRAYYQIEPWGGEKELLSKCVALLQMLVWAKYSKDTAEADKCVEEIVQSLMPGDWIGQPEIVEQSTEDSLRAFESIVSKAYG